MKRAAYVINGIEYQVVKRERSHLQLLYGQKGKKDIVFWFNTRGGCRVQRTADGLYSISKAAIPGQPKAAVAGAPSELVVVAQAILDEVSPMTLGQLGKAFTAPDVQKALGLARSHLGRATGLMLKRLFSKSFVARITALANEAFVAGAMVGSAPAAKPARKAR